MLRFISEVYQNNVFSKITDPIVPHLTGKRKSMYHFEWILS